MYTYIDIYLCLPRQVDTLTLNYWMIIRIFKGQEKTEAFELGSGSFCCSSQTSKALLFFLKTHLKIKY